MPEPDDLSDLRAVLAHLDDIAYLENHPFAARLFPRVVTRHLSRGQLLRRAIKIAMEEVSPVADTPLDAPGTRSYQVLQRYAIGKQSILAISLELGISERQAYRELRTATEALLHILLAGAATWVGNGTEETSAAPDAEGVRNEVGRLATSRCEQVDLEQVLQDVVRLAGNLAHVKGIDVRLVVGNHQLPVSASRIMLRQAALNLMSHAISLHGDTTLDVLLSRSGPDALLWLTYRPTAAGYDAGDAANPYAVSAELFKAQGATLTQEVLLNGDVRIEARIPLVGEPTVLVVDDNEGVVALFRSFLRHAPYRVIGAASFEEAVEQVAHVHPDVVLLDVMMPNRDGWEVLQALRDAETSGHTRVIMCSIINDPQLAYALGADGFLHKPVDRGSLIQALDDALSPVA